MVAKDDVDMESLQAQIDMSMSFAHNLVTSWIKPTHLAQLRSSSANTTQILEEELRRPPRLGVGAPTPTVPPLAREASRLKRKLAKNGARNEDVVESQPQGSTKSDEEEHKGRPSKRKTKADPFGHEGSRKKRKAEPKANSYSSVDNISEHSASLLNNSAPGECAKHNLSSRKDKQRMEPGDQQCSAIAGQRSMTLVPSSPETLPIQTTLSPSPSGPSLSEPSRETPVPVPGKPAPPECSRVYTNFVPIPDKAKSLGIPLLNLDGPPGPSDKTGNTSERNSPKKKRKRRKRKKNQMVASTGDN